MQGQSEVALESVAESVGKPSASDSAPALILILVSLVYVVSYMDQQIFPLLLPEISREIKLTDTQIGQLTGLAFPVIYGIASVSGAVAADRVNRAKLIGYSTILFSAMTAACGMTTGFGSIFLTRLGIGLGEAGPTPPSLSLIADNFEGSKRQIANSVYAAGAVFGMLAAYILIGNVSAAHGWRIGVYTAGALGLIVGLAVLLSMRDRERSSPQAMSFSDFKDFPALFRIPIFRWIVAAGMFHTNLTESSVQWLPLFLTRSLHMSEAEISWFLGLNYIILGLAGILIGGTIATRLRRKSVGRPQLFGCVVAISITVGYVIALLSLEKNISEVSLGVVILLSISNYGSLLAFIQDVTPDDGHAKATAVAFFLMNLAWGAGSLAIGVLSDYLACFCYYMAARHGDRDAARYGNKAHV
ncbi:MFS transporter [Paraburkholderia sp. D1E]|uniref:MFS transporter n=1 Tax=Paraburkholderia sp. D1E TaxID=3461398 RepID=UPI0040467B4A